MSELESLREQIDECDEKLVKLLERRLDIAKRIGRYKMEHNLPILDAARETELLKAREAMLQNKEYCEQAHDFFRYLMYLSRSVQAKLQSRREDVDFDEFLPADESIFSGATVAYQGCEGSYGHQALKSFFKCVHGKELAFGYFPEVFKAVASGQADFGVLPVENSSAGIVSEVYDLLGRSRCFIAAEHVVKIEHCLLGVKGAKIEDISEVYSHPHAIRQCGEYLSGRRWSVNEYSNTAAAARFVASSRDVKKAAIASELCAELYGLDVLEKGINFKDTNLTRFAIITNKPVIMPGADKISLTFTTQHRSGTLFEVLKHFAYNYINMLSIESRPASDKNWEYVFFADIEGRLDDESVQSALKGVQEASSHMRVLGCYKKGGEEKP